MEIYMVKGANGSFLNYHDDGSPYWDNDGGMAWLKDKDGEFFATNAAGREHGHTVKFNTCEKIKLSANQAKVIEQARDSYAPLNVLGKYAGFSAISVYQNKLIEAYVYGYEVDTPLYWVKVPHVEHYVYKIDDGEINIEPDSVQSESAKFTQDDINAHNLQKCQKVRINPMSDNRDDMFEELLGLYKNELMLALPHSARAEEKSVIIPAALNYFRDKYYGATDKPVVVPDDVTDFIARVQKSGWSLGDCINDAYFTFDEMGLEHTDKTYIWIVHNSEKFASKWLCLLY